MPITILQPQAIAPPNPRRMADSDSGSDSGSDSDSNGGADLEGDIDMRAPKRRRPSHDDEADEILTPGTVITSNPQWMR